MSRILRRPMFRGGRVDSRGTGIASGLSYNKGGRVGLKDSFPGTSGNAYDQMIKSNLGWKNKGIKSIPQDYFTKQEEWKQYEPKYPTDEALHQGYLNELENEQALIDSYMIEGPLTPDGDLYDRWSWLASPGGQKNWKEEQIAKQDADIAAAKAYDVNINTELNDLINKEAGELTQEQIIAQIRAEEEAKRQELIDLMNKKGTPEEEIEKNKKIFQKAYGSGIADDASNMLLNFAGKALKEGATTKSAFGEFFEEEGKRPSERKKYKDAATTAAINAYLTGQTSLQKFEDELGLYSKKIGMKNKADRALLEGMTIGEHKATISGAGKSDSQLTKAATERYIASQPGDKGKILNTFSSKKDPIEKLLVEENVNEYFMDGDTKQIFKIIKIGDEITFDRLY